MTKSTTVGELRAQSAYCDGKRRVIAVTNDPELFAMLNGRRIVVVRSYPDTTDEHGEWTSPFKIELALE